MVSGKAKESVAQTFEAKSKTYQQGIEELRRASWEIPREQVHMYMQRKNGIETWKKFNQGNATSASIPLESLRQVAEEDVEYAEWVHTHTLSVQYPDFGDREKARHGELPVLLMPPSFMDLSGAVKLMSSVSPKVCAKLSFKAADPGGVWEYIPRRGSQFFWMVQEVDQEISSMDALDSPEVKQFVEAKGLGDEDPRVIFQVLVEHRSELSESLRIAVTRIVALEEELMKNKHIRNIIAIELGSPHASFSHNDTKLIDLIKHYKALGVSLTFMPYKSE